MHVPTSEQKWTHWSTDPLLDTSEKEVWIVDSVHESILRSSRDINPKTFSSDRVRV